MTAEFATPIPDIECDRLLLRWMSPAFIKASLDGRLDVAASELGQALPEGWPEAPLREWMPRRLEEMTASPEAAEWLLRAMVRRADGEVVGYVNFHDPPDEAGRAELGYTVFEPHRRQGYATEAALAMMRWAHDSHGVSTFVVSISPVNEPSLRMAAAMGFVQTGSQMDEVDGEEWVFDLSWDDSRKTTSS